MRELKLLDCPFCGSEAEYEGLYCYCTRCGCRMADDPDEASAIAAWNRRASPTPEREGGGAIEAAKRIVDWDDNGRLADDEWLVERNETAIIAICRALLSTPVDARREALEEAAQVANEVAADDPDEASAITVWNRRASPSGMAVVPVEPTEAMLDSGGSAIIRPSVYMGGTPPGAKRSARDVWAAMLAAAKPAQDEDPDPPYTIKRRAS